MEVAASFLLKMSSVLASLRNAADEHVAEARKMKNEAGALLFRKAHVVGATVVGASRRLEAIRAAEPLAVLVEEACEVMEPTLVSYYPIHYSELNFAVINFCILGICSCSQVTSKAGAYRRPSPITCIRAKLLV